MTFSTSATGRKTRPSFLKHAMVTGLSLALMTGLSGCSEAISMTTAAVTPEYTGGKVAYAAGTPTVVFEHGADEKGKGTWNGMISKVRPFAPTFAYSRTGWGDNPFGDVPAARTPSVGAAALRHRLQKAGVQPPYILVGHSVGSYYVLNFARQWPNEVAGIVLVDGRLPAFTANCKKHNGNLCDPMENELIMALMPAAGRSEINGEKQGRHEIPAPSELGAIPVTVIYNTKQEFPHNDGFMKGWAETQTAYAAGLQNGEAIPVAGGHDIHHTYPDIVTNAIRKQVDAARARAAN